MICVTFRADEFPESEKEKALIQALDDAQGTSLLIEEIGSLPLPLQALISRAITEGGRRILATTSVPLPDLITGSRFREDLYYQLAVLQVTLPPLTERVEDIQALALTFLTSASSKAAFTLAPETLACLKAHNWPGHVRELAAAMQHVTAVCQSSLVLPRHLPENIIATLISGGVNHLDSALNRALSAWLDQRVTGAEDALPNYDTLLAQVEKQMLVSLLERFDDKPTRLAAALQMNRATLRRKLRDLLGRE